MLHATRLNLCLPSRLISRSTNFNRPILSRTPIQRHYTDGQSPTTPENIKASKALGFFGKDRIVETQNFNRWRMVPPAILTHICLGSVFAWSLMNDLLIRELGVIVSSAGDWTLSAVVPVFSTILALHGVSAALVGKWQEHVGPRASGIVGAFCFGGGLIIGGLGVLFHQLPLLYLGYGVLGGLGMGFAYVPPVATLIRWFPDRRGMATGLTIMGFGGGALVATPIMGQLVQTFREAPQYLGKTDTLSLITKEGRQFVNFDDGLKEVVVATVRDASSSPFPGLHDGVYVVGTGSTGAGMTLVGLGMGYFCVMIWSALSYKIPPPNYRPSGWTPPKQVVGGLVSSKNVHIDTVMRTPQFWQIWLSFATLSTAGMAVVSVAKTMMVEIFAKALPLIVTGSFTAGYIMAISVANLGGRLLWSAGSDYIGRKNVFTIFFITSIPLFMLIPTLVEQVANGSVLPLAIFYGSTLIIYSMFGAGYATTPAYEADLFGQKYCGAIHGRMLTASALASVVGPMTITAMRAQSEHAAIHDLVLKVNPEQFHNVFGADLSYLDSLIKAKTVTINKLMQLVPPDTVDPTPYLYNNTMYSAAALLVVGAVANLTIKAVNPKFFMADEITTKAAEKEVPPKFTYAVCIDGTVHSDAAFDYVIQNINPQTQRLLIISVDFPHIVPFHQPHWPLLPEDAHNEKRLLLMKYANKAKALGLDFSALMIVAPNIGEAICFTASYRKADLLVLGSSGKKGLTTMLGTISKYCADNVNCNIMFVKNKNEKAEEPTVTDEEVGEWENIHEERSAETVQSPIKLYQFTDKKK